jgi:hypothetical protein
MADSKQSAGKLRGLALEKEVVQLRLAGAGYELIARNLGCSVGGAYAALKRAIDRQIKEINETAGHVLELELKRIDVMLLGIWAKAMNGDVGAIDRALKLMDRRARYLGLDAPQRMEHTGKEGGPIQHEYDFSHLSDSELDRELAETVAQAESITRGAVAEGEAG